jgi:hypothetical protein
MKTNMQRFNVISFLIALLSIQIYSSMELSQAVRLSSLSNFTKVEQPSESFEQLCYYELKVDLIIKNYVIRIEDEVNKIFDKDAILDRNHIKFDYFFKVFKGGKYGQVAPELAQSEDYVRSYWNYFVTKNSESMTEKEFTKFMGLYFLEGDLLVTESHPTLTPFFKNDHHVNRRIGCNVAIAFWKLSSELLQRIFIEFKWNINDQTITKSEILTILTNTHTGKCHISMNKKCPFFTEFIGNVLGFFNMSAGKRETLTIKETKVVYSTFLFSDVYDKQCTQHKFDEEIQKKRIKELNLP